MSHWMTQYLPEIVTWPLKASTQTIGQALEEMQRRGLRIHWWVGPRVSENDQNINDVQAKQTLESWGLPKSEGVKTHIIMATSPDPWK